MKLSTSTIRFLEHRDQMFGEAPQFYRAVCQRNILDEGYSYYVEMNNAVRIARASTGSEASLAAAALNYAHGCYRSHAPQIIGMDGVA